ncbi:MAG: HipA N-terminal domain-containing protein [Chlamydiales bacterium]|nr:HipA N-terminal domain-containing protein [Chlamydiales bacterium]
MKKANVFVNGCLAGELLEIQRNKNYRFIYSQGFQGPSVSLTMPVIHSIYEFDRFPPFFEGLLPEGAMLEGLLRYTKIDRNDFMSQIIAVGKDLVGNVTVEASNE